MLNMKGSIMKTLKLRKAILTMLILSILLMVTSCTPKNKFDEITTDYSVQGLYGQKNIDVYDDSFYVRNSESLFYIDGSLPDATKIADLVYADDVEVDPDTSHSFENYSERIDSNINIVGSRIVFITKYEDKEYNTKYNLSSINLNGDDKKVHKSFDHLIGRLYITDGNLIIEGSKDDENIKYIMDKSLNIKEAPKLPRQISATYKDRVFLINSGSDPTDNDPKDYYLDMNDMKIHDFNKEDGTLLAINNDYYALDTGVYNIDDPTKSTTTSSLYSLENNEKLLTIDGETIVSIKDGYLYTSSSYGKQVYKKYDLKGNLISQLDPHKIIGEPKVLDSNLNYGYSPIQAVGKDKSIASFANVDMTNKYLVIDFAKETITVVKTGEEINVNE